MVWLHRRIVPEGTMRPDCIVLDSPGLDLRLGVFEVNSVPSSKRWTIEETIRYIKTCYDLENVRVLNYQGLQNLMPLLLALN